MLIGNQIGGILTNYIIESQKAENKLNENGDFIKTIVNSEFGDANNLEVMNVPTAFKFIGKKIKSFEESNHGKTYLFGYKESYGYLL